MTFKLFFTLSLLTGVVPYVSSAMEQKETPVFKKSSNLSIEYKKILPTFSSIEKHLPYNLKHLKDNIDSFADDGYDRTQSYFETFYDAEKHPNPKFITLVTFEDVDNAGIRNVLKNQAYSFSLKIRSLKSTRDKKKNTRSQINQRIRNTIKRSTSEQFSNVLSELMGKRIYNSLSVLPKASHIMSPQDLLAAELVPHTKEIYYNHKTKTSHIRFSAKRQMHRLFRYFFQKDHQKEPCHHPQNCIASSFDTTLFSKFFSSIYRWKNNNVWDTAKLQNNILVIQDGDETYKFYLFPPIIKDTQSPEEIQIARKNNKYQPKPSTIEYFLEEYKEHFGFLPKEVSFEELQPKLKAFYQEEILRTIAYMQSNKEYMQKREEYLNPKNTDNKEKKEESKNNDVDDLDFN